MEGRYFTSSEAGVLESIGLKYAASDCFSSGDGGRDLPLLVMSVLGVSTRPESPGVLECPEKIELPEDIVLDDEAVPFLEVLGRRS